ncbi:MAG TPA: hypothetical protein P5137_12265 [Candidatus Brocadiia bacterium]|nr:hypothetical protein [Candidatus Brocadiia bacterium]
MKERIVFRDDFTSYPVAPMMKAGLLEDRFGPWTQTSHHYSWHSKRVPHYHATTLPWRVIETAEGRCLEQPEVWPNVVVCAGDAAWEDYTLETEVTPLSRGRCGVLFRYQTSRRNYYLAFENGKTLSLYRREDDELILLRSVACRYKTRAPQRVRVALAGERIKVFVDRLLRFSVSDGVLRHGKIGLRTDAPARYGAVSVRMDKTAQALVERNQRDTAALIRRKSAALPRPKVVHEIPISAPADYFHMDDLDGDGKPEVVFLEQEVLGPDNTRVASLGAMTLDGGILWREGRPAKSCYPVHSDVAFNIGDVNGDGRKEILVTREGMLQIVDSSNGRVLNETPTPPARYGSKEVPHIIGDSILLADLAGKGRRTDILLKDRYTNIWAYDSRLRLLWTRALNTGHYPRAGDINGDGREEVMAGYSMLSADGETLWTVPGSDPLRNYYPGPEHADSLWIGRFDGTAGGPVRVAMAASDMGFLLLDAVTGRLLVQDKCGHAQHLAIAPFRRDLPGCQFIVGCFWGNPGIMTVYDHEGRKLRQKEIPPLGLVVPLDWTGDGTIHALNARTLEVVDDELDVVLRLSPRKAACKNARPVTGDFLGLGRDQVAVRDEKRIALLAADLPVKRGRSPLAHDHENFNLYGAFYMDKRPAQS